MAGTQPVLAHPATANVFALPYGTAYAIWLPEPEYSEAVAAGLRPQTTWSPGHVTDLGEVLGPGWLFGAWRPEEMAWIAAAHRASG